MPNGYVLNYVILITHSSHLYSMWDFTHTCNPTITNKNFMKNKILNMSLDMKMSIPHELIT